MKTLLMYMPVVHAGYITLVEKLKPDRVLIVSDEIAHEFDKRRKDIRALTSTQITMALWSLFPKLKIDEFVSSTVIPDDEEIHMPVEDISEDILQVYLGGRTIIWESVFLRYDSKKSSAQEVIVPDRIVTMSDPHIVSMVKLLRDEAIKSPDWWLQVPAAITKGGKLLSLVHNIHMPTNVITSALGDPRSNAKKGFATNVSKAAHAEPLACFIAGVEGCHDAELHVGVFPCPQCSNFISFTGIRSLYYISGYSMVNGADDMRSMGIEIVKIET